jgi:hypothetical protein
MSITITTWGPGGTEGPLQCADLAEALRVAEAAHETGGSVVILGATAPGTRLTSYLGVFDTEGRPVNGTGITWAVKPTEEDARAPEPELDAAIRAGEHIDDLRAEAQEEARRWAAYAAGAHDALLATAPATEQELACREAFAAASRVAAAWEDAAVRFAGAGRRPA